MCAMQWFSVTPELFYHNDDQVQTIFITIKIHGTYQK